MVCGTRLDVLRAGLFPPGCQECVEECVQAVTACEARAYGEALRSADKNQSLKRGGWAIRPWRKNMLKTLRYYWNAARGYRLKPWKSPYLRWRFETFLGKEADNLTARKFFHLAWKYREHMKRFVDWAAERHRLQHRRHA